MINAVIFIVILAMVFVFPILIAFGTMKSLRAKKDKKGLLLLVILCAAGLVYFVYAAFYPTDGICVDKYERYTALKFPVSGKILEKEASIINDIKGSFTDCYLVEMNEADYVAALDSIIAQNKFHQHDSFLVFSRQYKKVEKKLDGRGYRHVFSDGSKAYIFMGFLDDAHCILVNIVGRQSEMSALPPVVNHRVQCGIN